MITNKWTGEEFDAEFIYPFHAINTRKDGTIALNATDYEYHNLIIKILSEGLWKQNRTGVKTLSIFGPQVTFKDVGEKFPLLTTKKIHLKSVIGELLWFLSGSTNKHELKEKYGTSIWDEWGDDETGELGPIYGHQWVNWEYEKVHGITSYDASGPVDKEKGEKEFDIYHVSKKESINQLQNIINTLKTNPDDRRMIVSAWHVDQIKDMALPPCHWSYQFYTNQYPNEEKRRLHIKMNIRSWDIFLGGPFNIASYALLLLMMAQEVDMLPGDLIISAGDVHIYENHLEYITKQLNRESKGSVPKMEINKTKGFWDFEPSDFNLTGYDPHPNWKNVPVAI